MPTEQTSDQWAAEFCMKYGGGHANWPTAELAELKRKADAYDKYRFALARLVELTVRLEVDFEHQRGESRSFAKMEADGDVSEELTAATQLLAEGS